MPITELSISSLRLAPIFVARISSGGGAGGGGGGGETVKEGEGGEERRRGKNGRDRSVAMRFLIASQAKRGDAKIQTFRLYLSNLLFKRVENSRFFFIGI